MYDLRTQALDMWKLDGNKPLPEHGTVSKLFQYVDKHAALGIKPRHPFEGHAVWIYVMSKYEAERRGIKQRLRAICPKCQGAFALGNLEQHMHGRIGRGRIHICRGDE